MQNSHECRNYGSNMSNKIISILFDQQLRSKNETFINKVVKCGGEVPEALL